MISKLKIFALSLSVTICCNTYNAQAMENNNQTLKQQADEINNIKTQLDTLRERYNNLYKEIDDQITFLQTDQSQDANNAVNEIYTFLGTINSEIQGIYNHLTQLMVHNRSNFLKKLSNLRKHIKDTNKLSEMIKNFQTFING